MTPMNLRERAALAYLDHLATTRDALLADARGALAEIIGPFDEWEVLKAAPAMNPPTAELAVDGMEFRVTIATVEHKATESNKGMVWEEDVVSVSVRRGETYHRVDSLADVGRVFHGDPLPGEKPAAGPPTAASPEACAAPSDNAD